MLEPLGPQFSAHSSEMEMWSSKLCLVSLFNCITSTPHGISDEKKLGVYASFRAFLKGSGK